MQTKTINDYRAEYKVLRSTAQNLGCTTDFKAECLKVCVVVPTTPAEWVSAAELVVFIHEPESHFEDFDAEGPGITEPWEVAYGPRDYNF